VGPVSVLSDWVGYHVYLRHDTSVCWQFKTRLESGPVTADLTTTVGHSYKLLINDVNHDHSFTQYYYLSVFFSSITEKYNHNQLLRVNSPIIQ